VHPLIEGGAQEGGKRAGEQVLPAAAGLGAAAAIAAAEGPGRAEAMRRSAARLAGALAAIPDLRLNGPRGARVPGNVHVSVAGVRGDTLAAALGARGVCLSPGSTCTAAAGRPSPALEALGLGPEWTRGAILASTGPATADEEIDHAAAIAAEEVARLRAMAPASA
jgi:cysteine desulfurase